MDTQYNFLTSVALRSAIYPTGHLHFRVLNLKWHNKPYYTIHLSCTTTGKNQFELVTASLNHVLPLWNGSSPRPPLEFSIFPQDDLKQYIILNQVFSNLLQNTWHVFWLRQGSKAQLHTDIVQTSKMAHARFRYKIMQTCMRLSGHICMQCLN